MNQRNNEMNNRPTTTPDTDQAAAPLTFSYKNMVDLVVTYESYRKLEQSIMLLTGTIPDNPILSGLRSIDEIIMDVNPVFNEADEEF